MNFINISTDSLQEKQVLIDNIKINYKIIGNGNAPIILLHGWGINSDKYIETAKQLLLQTTNYKLQTKVIVPDLPGFGKSDNSPKAWDIDNYVELMRKFTEVSLRASEGSAAIPCFNALSVELLRRSAPRNDKIIIIGHSFGGRIAIKFAAKYPKKLKCLILTGAAGIKHPPTIKQRIFFMAAKIGKIIFSLPVFNVLEKPAQKLLYTAAREKDYYNAGGVMKETFKRVLAEDLKPLLVKINTPTLLIWGKNDRSTPIGDALIMKEKIKNSKLEIVENTNHGLPYKKPESFAKIASQFLNSF